LKLNSLLTQYYKVSDKFKSCVDDKNKNNVLNFYKKYKISQKQSLNEPPVAE